MIGTTEILVIGGIIILIFGGAAIPKLARNLGQAKSEFRKGLTESKKKPELNNEG